ncbi:MAG: MBL fold metallo-hydrolase [Verrucomicrobiaceae bacterium]|nr:MBL fold metallo-hydrolase [Verrucomicrobiaceae bacterium]
MNIHTIDLRFQGIPGIIASYLIECGDELALIETGPGSCHEALINGIRALGHEPAAIKHVFVTHIHLDHSGAAGWWAQQGAMVYCHANAAKHLIDPARLIESARMVYGAAMDTLWGDILPAPADRVRVLQDNESVTIGTSTVTAWDTPGHARHHHAYVIGDVCFTGDVAGVRLQNSDYISVAAAPPQFDPDEYVKSVQRLCAANFSRLYLTHFGEVRNARDHLAAYEARIGEVAACVKSSFDRGDNGEKTRAFFCEAEHAAATRTGLSEEMWTAYECGNSTAMCADGIRLYWEKLEGKGRT